MIPQEALPASDEDQTLLTVTVRMVTARSHGRFVPATLQKLVPGIECLGGCNAPELDSPEFGDQVASAVPFASRCLSESDAEAWPTIETVAAAMSRAARREIGMQAALVALRAEGFLCSDDRYNRQMRVNVAKQSLFSAGNAKTAPRSPSATRINRDER